MCQAQSRLHNYTTARQVLAEVSVDKKVSGLERENFMSLENKGDKVALGCLREARNETSYGWPSQVRKLLHLSKGKLETSEDIKEYVELCYNIVTRPLRNVHIILS